MMYSFLRGYFTLGELLSVKWNGIPGIERDLHFEPVTVGECSFYAVLFSA